MMYARSLDFARQAHPSLRHISQSRAGGPEKLAIAAVSAGLVTAGLVLARSNNVSIQRHFLHRHSFAYPVVSGILSTSHCTSSGNPVHLVMDTDVEPMILALKAEAGECRRHNFAVSGWALTNVQKHSGITFRPRPPEQNTI